MSSSGPHLLFRFFLVVPAAVAVAVDAAALAAV